MASPSGDWSGQQLAEFLAAVSSFGHEDAALVGAAERVAEALEAEVGAIVQAGRVVSCVGFPRGRTPEAELCEAAAGERVVIDVPGAGSCAVLSIGLEDDTVDGAGPSWLVLARSGGGFSPDESALARAMVRVLTLTLRMLRTLEAERRSRERSELHAEENARLLETLRERQTLLERLFGIQRSISHRAPITEVLDAVAKGAAELLGADVVAVRLVDPDDPDRLLMLSTHGIDDELADAIAGWAPTGGVSSSAVSSGRLIVTHDYPAREDRIEPLVADGVVAVMAAPVFRAGEPAGALVVGSRDPQRRYGVTDQETVLAFAEHCSLALNDASAVDAMRKAFAHAVHQAHHDALTGLPNRALVLDRLGHALARSQRECRSVGVLFVDLDRFKMVNDTLGHSVGDDVLIRIGERLLGSVRPGDMVGRLAGDEFVVVCEDVDTAGLLKIADRVAEAVEAPLSLYGRDAVITASIGVAQVATGGRPEDVLRDADVAMYRAKERGRARIEVFDSSVRARLLERLETEQALRRAIGRGEMRLHYQPIVGASDGVLLGVEALVRWQHRERGLVPPADFIPLAEETGLITSIGRWVLTEACSQLGRWQAADPRLRSLKVGVNLSARQFTDPNLVPLVAEALAVAGIEPQSVSLEITESVLMEEVQATAQTLRALKDLGVCLSIDDFGTGYSSLSYLKRFPVDVLKIDRSFVDGLGVDAEDDAIVTAVVSLAHALNLEVVAEGVETELQLMELRRLGCDAAQGYLLGRPAEAAHHGPQLSAELPKVFGAGDDARFQRRAAFPA